MFLAVMTHGSLAVESYALLAAMTSQSFPNESFCSVLEGVKCDGRYDLVFGDA